VVSKLLAASAADFAIFGEKDYQQLKVVTQLARDLDLATEIIAVPTVREVDGLALSSRNAYLTSPQRAAAPLLYRSLAEAAHAISKGETASQAIAGARQELRRAGFRVDYVACRNAETLAPAKSPSEPMRITSSRPGVSFAWEAMAPHYAGRTPRPGLATALLDALVAHGAPIRGRGTDQPLPGRAEQVPVRAACCLAYRTDPPVADPADALCTTCPLLDPPERARRYAAWLMRVAPAGR